MDTLNINHSQEPMRLFRSDFFERFTHTHPVVVLILWLPVVFFFLGRAITEAARVGGAWCIPVGFLIGLFAWSFTEYTLHRWAFHFQPRTPWQEKIAFLVHGVHHDQPQLKTRLVMPPVVSVPLALLFYGIFRLVVNVVLGAPYWFAPLFAGFVAGYVIYDMTHYATHHLPMRWGILKILKRQHMMHHYKTPDRCYGVTSPLWDIVFGTMA